MMLLSVVANDAMEEGEVFTFEEGLTEAVAVLQPPGRVSSRAVKRQADNLGKRLTARP